MKLLFFGSDSFAIPSLAALASAKHDILAVVTQPDRPAGRGQKVTPCPVALVAKEKKLPLLQPPKLKEVEKELLQLQPEILVVVAYGQFIPQSLIEKTLHQAVNVHPSLLPKYRGAAPIQWAILNGDRITGVSTMTITPEMDAGDIYLQYETPIDPAETSAQLHDRLSEMGAELLLKTLEGIQAGKLKPKPQDSSKTILAPKIKKEDGHLDWKEPAEKLYNKIRAFDPWPGTFCLLWGKRLKIFEAGVLEARSQKGIGTIIDNERGILVACGQGALCLLEVQLEGKKRLNAEAFLKGHFLKIGTQLQ